MGRLNCWEFTQCGREVNGANVDTFGPCPASTEARTNGLNGGTNGGRVCYCTPGTLCGYRGTGSKGNKTQGCMKCGFYWLVRVEEAGNRVPSRLLLGILGNPTVDYRTEADP